MSRYESRRRVHDFDEYHATATQAATMKEIPSLPVTTENINSSTSAAQRAHIAERRRTQQQCRDYWRKVYGRDAERASRGGVSWLGGAHA